MPARPRCRKNRSARRKLSYTAAHPESSPAPKPRLQAGPIARAIAGGDALQGERVYARVVDTKVGRAGGAIAGRADQIADDRVRVAIGITEGLKRHAELILQFFFAGRDFLAPLPQRTTSQ